MAISLNQYLDDCDLSSEWAEYLEEKYTLICELDGEEVYTDNETIFFIEHNGLSRDADGYWQYEQSELSIESLTTLLLRKEGLINE